MLGKARNVGTVAGLAGAALLTACALVAPKPGPGDTARPAEVATDNVPDTPQAASPPARPVPPPASQPPRTAVIVSDDIPEYAQIVAEILGRALDHVSVYDLGGLESNGSRVLAEIRSAQPDRLIAIGLLAATVARELAATPTVFCQVYNYPDYDLLSPTSKGVYLLPPFDLQLRAWRSLAPDLDRVGIITGPGQEGLIGEIRASAASAGVTLAVRTVRSDQEALLAFKELVPEMEGFYLLPDNRILSPDVVRQILAYSADHERQLAVFGETLLGMGALLGFTSDPPDIVDRVLARFENVDADGALQGPDMLSLTKARVSVNRAVAARLGLAVPERLASSR